MRAKKYGFTAKDIAEAVGWSRRDVYRAIKKGYFNPDSFWNTYSFVEMTRLGNSISPASGVAQYVPTNEELSKMVFNNPYAGLGEEPQKAVESKEAALAKELEELKISNAKLFSDVGLLTAENERLENELEKVRSYPLEEKGLYWRSLVIKLRDELRRYQSDGSQ